MSLSLGAGLAVAAGAESVGSGLINYGMQKDQQAFNAAEAEKARAWEAEQAAITREYNSVEAQKSRDWSEYMSSSAYQRSVADMKAAGINPASLGGAGASSPAAAGNSAHASAGNPSVSSAHSAMAHAAVSGISDAIYNGAKLKAMQMLATSPKKSDLVTSLSAVMREGAALGKAQKSLGRDFLSKLGGL